MQISLTSGSQATPVTPKMKTNKTFKLSIPDPHDTNPHQQVARSDLMACSKLFSMVTNLTIYRKEPHPNHWPDSRGAAPNIKTMSLELHSHVKTPVLKPSIHK